MKQALQISFIVLFAFMLQACGNTIDRVKFQRALGANDIDQFKAEVTRTQSAPGISTKDRDSRLYYALQFAAGSSLEATRYVIDQGVPLDYPTGQSTSTQRGMALVGAVEAYQPKIVRLLLERGADPDIEIWSIDPRNNILYISFMHSDLVISKILLEGGANPNLWRNPFYPSLMAHYGGHPKIQSLLKEYGGVTDPTPEQRAGLVKSQPAPKVAAVPVQAKHDATDKTVEERLQTILALKEQGVIDPEEYSEARTKILGAYSGGIRPLIPLQSGPPVPEQTGPVIPVQTGPLIPVQSGPLFPE